MSGHRVEASRVVMVEPTLAFDRLISTPLPQIFSRRYAAFPPIREVRDEPADWGTVGQSRTIVLADAGGQMRETLTEVDPPHGFAYVLDDLHGPLRPLVATIEGAWSVAPEGGGAEIGWTWTLYPRAAPARLTLNVLGRMWQGYAERALAQLETILTRP